jgi:hypothetical protein
MAFLVACAVCGLGSTQDNWLAYFTMTMVLSALPLGMIGGVVFWLHRRSRETAREIETK